MLADHGIVCRTSEKGECLDKAVAERLFGSVKRAWTSHGYDATHQEARNEIIDYIELFDNSRRKHSSLGYVRPNTFEQLALVA
jgi:putative transposase